MFACRNLNLSYKGNKILKDIHFHIPEGTVFCITGESGSGKSSLLKVINGIIPEITEAEISGEIKLNDMRREAGIFRPYIKIRKHSFIALSLRMNWRFLWKTEICRRMRWLR